MGVVVFHPLAAVDAGQQGKVFLRDGPAVFTDQAADRALIGAQPLAQNAFKLTLLPRTIVRALEQVGGRP